VVSLNDQEISNLFRMPVLVRNWFFVAICSISSQLIHFLRIRKTFLYIVHLRIGFVIILKGGFNAHDIGDIFEVFSKRVYMPKQFSNLVLSSIPENGDVNIVDIGASNGDFTLYISNLIPRSKVYSYEADPGTFRILQSNMLLNKMGDEKVSIFNKFIYNNSSVGNGIILGKEIECGTLQDILSLLNNIHLLKLDIEGEEFDVLLSLKHDELRKISFITMEIHLHTASYRKNIINYATT